ncbi:hypothetical protein CRE_01287 [Caenorhabditis remanei]|uniref:Uncharacterized protein n=1 Tax=Caenorhabditis remanei TaxID=31234 RepID=E3N9S5_CAERE|nr:hypothetical protein CRE_01287 [Caenorhabditis remanei]
MKFLAIFLVILSVFNMMLVEANESTQKPLNRRRRPDPNRIIIGMSPASYKIEREKYLRQQQQNGGIIIGGKQQPIAPVKLAGY